MYIKRNNRCISVFQAYLTWNSQVSLGYMVRHWLTKKERKKKESMCVPDKESRKVSSEDPVFELRIGRR